MVTTTKRKTRIKVIEDLLYLPRIPQLCRVLEFSKKIPEFRKTLEFKWPKICENQGKNKPDLEATTDITPYLKADFAHYPSKGRTDFAGS